MRLNAGDKLIRNLEYCQWLADYAGLPEPVHRQLLRTLNLAIDLHNAPDRVDARNALEDGRYAV